MARRCSTLCLPDGKGEYAEIIDPPARFRAWLDAAFRTWPERFPTACPHPGGHRTSNMLDRVMRGMSRYFEDGQHLHGSPQACGFHVRAWALLQNFRPWCPEAVRDTNG